MSPKTLVDPRSYQEAMRVQFEQTMRLVMEAVNAAPDGAWIEGSEHQVRDLMVGLQQKAYETALQMRTQAAEAAFSPSGCGDGGQIAAFQGVGSAQRVDGQRPSGRAAARVSGRAGRSGVAGG